MFTFIMKSINFEHNLIDWQLYIITYQIGTKIGIQLKNGIIPLWFCSEIENCGFWQKQKSIWSWLHHDNHVNPDIFRLLVPQRRGIFVAQNLHTFLHKSKNEGKPAKYWNNFETYIFKNLKCNTYFIQKGKCDNYLFCPSLYLVVLRKKLELKSIEHWGR